MSEYHIAIVAEGPTDIVVIQNLVKKSFQDKRFVFHRLSPTDEELSSGRKAEGFGWGSVYKVCHDLITKMKLLEEANALIDLLIIHVDGDVAFKRYGEAHIQTILTDLPCGNKEWSVMENCDALQTVVAGWLCGISIPRVLCIPYICTETWVAALIFPEFNQGDFEKMEEIALYRKMIEKTRSKKEKLRRLIQERNGRFKKNTGVYASLLAQITLESWQGVCEKLEQAERFDRDLKAGIRE